MAQNITLMGASYQAVPAVTLPQTGGGTASFTDVTDTTATASDVAQGKYFHLATGERVAGTASGGGGDTYTLTTVVPQQTFTPQEISGSYQTTVTYTAGLEDGEYYLVTFDGEQYVCTCGLYWGTDYLAGYVDLFWGGSAISPYPFGIGYTPSVPEFSVGSYDTNQHTIKVEHLEFTDGYGGTIVQSEIPSYVRTAAETLADSVRAVQTSSTITFLAISDAHHLTGNADRLAAIKHAGMAAKIVGLLAPLDFAFHGGDATDGSSSTTLADGKAEIELTNRWLAEAFDGVPNFRTPGNHDALRQNTDITPLTDAELYQYFGKYNADGTTVMGSTSAGYCYRDFASPKSCRVICLNTAEGAKENVSDAQRLWFAQTLAGTPSGCGVVVLSHHPLDWGNVNQCSEVLYQYHEQGSVAISGTTVSFASANPAFVVCFHGHTHCYKTDNMHRVQNSIGTPYDMKRIATPNICFNRNNEYGSNAGAEYYGIEYGETTTYNKTADSAQDTAFVVNVIDPTNEVVHSFHYGAGRDRAVGIGATVYHMVTTSLTHVTLTGGSATVEDGTSYSATLTPATGYDMASVTIMMGSTNVTSTAYNSSTGAVSIASVTDDLAITAVATEHVSYTNLVPTAVTSAGAVCGYKNGYYVSGSGKVGDFSANASFVATGAMALPSGWKYIYVKGVPMLSGDSHERYYFGDANKTVYQNGGYINATNYAAANMTIETLGTNYYRISSTHANTKAASFVAMSFKATDGADLIVTADEPIE